MKRRDHSIYYGTFLFNSSVSNLKFLHFDIKTTWFEEFEVSTEPLGQRISIAVEFVIEQYNFSSTYSTKYFPSIFDHYTYVICGGGCFREWVSTNMCSLVVPCVSGD